MAGLELFRMYICLCADLLACVYVCVYIGPAAVCARSRLLVVSDPCYIRYGLVVASGLPSDCVRYAAGATDWRGLVFARQLGEHSPAALKVPAVAKTGNPDADQDSEARRECLMKLIDTLIEQPMHVLPVYTELQRRLRQASTRVQTNDATFEHLTTFGKLDDKFCTEFILRRSDLNIGDIVKAKQIDDRAIQQLMTYELQLSSSLKFPAQAQVIAVMRTVLEARSLALGNPLKSFKAHGGLKSTGELVWSCGAYRLTIEGDLVSEVKHFSGAIATIDTKKIKISTEHTLHNNWDEWSAHLVQPPMPAIFLHSLFKDTKVGPHSRPKITGQSKVFEKEVLQHYNIWKEAKDLDSATTPTAMAVRHELDLVETKRRRTAMEKARATAEEKLKEQKKRRTIALVAKEQ